MRLCGGRFASYLENKFGIKKLPYNIKLIDLILDTDNTDELFVELPKEYFLGWDSYPCLGEEVKESSSDFDIFALALWACLFHRCVFSALVAFDVVTKLTVHWGVVC